jgi:hypothetical protein
MEGRLVFRKKEVRDEEKFNNIGSADENKYQT